MWKCVCDIQLFIYYYIFLMERSISKKKNLGKDNYWQIKLYIFYIEKNISWTIDENPKYWGHVSRSLYMFITLITEIQCFKPTVIIYAKRKQFEKQPCLNNKCDPINVISIKYERCHRKSLPNMKWVQKYDFWWERIKYRCNSWKNEWCLWSKCDTWEHCKPF